MFNPICENCNVQKELWTDYFARCPKCKKKSVLPD